MCGIVGMKRPGANAEVDEMLDQIQHRGPDDRGVIELSRWTLGHVRLSVIDPENARQPMKSQSGRSTIVHNGEIYNFRELRTLFNLQTSGDSDTELLLELYESDLEPSSWIKELDGMFAFAIVGAKGLLLARDPIGVKPMYVGKSERDLIFASEMKAIQKQTCKFLEFPPGYYYLSGRGARAYYEIPKSFSPHSGFDRASKKLRRLVTNSVQTRMLSDVPLGAFLSGGLDSSIIAAIAVKVDPQLKTFSVGIEGSDDITAAREVAEFLGTDHHERLITVKEAIDILPKVIRQLESFDSALVRSAVPNYFLAELASQHVKVALSGEGADELFAGYAYLKELPLDELNGELVRITKRLHNTNLQRCDRMSMAHGLEVRVPFLDNVELLEFGLGLPVQYKVNTVQGIEKWILRDAFRDMLPERIIKRKKQKFADGAGLGSVIGAWASIQPNRLECGTSTNIEVRDQEEAMYLRLFEQNFPGSACASLVGRSRSV